MRADLHVHSTASDGTLSPESLVALAISVGLTHLAIADHDSVEGIRAALTAARSSTVTLIPAVELSSLTPQGDDVHILGYGVDIDSEPLLTTLEALRVARVRRARRMIDSLQESGVLIAFEDVLGHSNGGAVGRSHVARALVGAGHSASVASAFDVLIGRGRPHYIPKEAPTPEAVITTVLDAGGLPVIAHPGVNGLAALTRSLGEAGLSGIEAFHADHTATQRDEYVTLARELGLPCTGGSDFHAPDGPNPPLGSVDYPVRELRGFLDALSRR